MPILIFLQLLLTRALKAISIPEAPLVAHSIQVLCIFLEATDAEAFNTVEAGARHAGVTGHNITSLSVFEHTWLYHN